MDKIKPHFHEGGKLAKLESVYDGMETFLFTPNTTSRSGVHIHDSNDMKRTMITVVVALLPCLLFAMYNIGYQHFAAIGVNDATFWQMFLFGLLAMLPVIVVSYVVGLGIEFIGAQIHHKEIQEGFLVTGILIPLIVPINTPLWMAQLGFRTDCGSDFCQGDIWWHRNEHLQRGTYHSCIPVLCLSLKDEW